MSRVDRNKMLTARGAFIKQCALYWMQANAPDALKQIEAEADKRYGSLKRNQSKGSYGFLGKVKS